MVDDIQKKLLRESMLDIASEIARVCQLIGVQYFIVAGTALGAKRHQGFIPWDSDFDVAFKRKDYETFLKQAPLYLDQRYLCCSYHNVKNWYSPHAIVFDLKTEIFWNRDHYVNKQNCPVYVDLFSLDAIPTDDKLSNSLEKKVFHYIRLLSRKECLIYKHNNSFQRFLKKTFSCILKVFCPGNKINEKLDKLMQKYNKTCSEKIGIMPSRYGFKKESISEVIIGNPKLYTFEGKAFYSYEQIENYLHQLYGDFYQLPPIEERYENFNNIDHILFDKTLKK